MSKKLGVGTTIEVRFAVTKGTGPVRLVWWPAGVSTLVVKQDNNVNRLLGTLKYKAMYGFRATTSHVTFHDLDDVVDEDGNMYKWRSATNSTGKAVSHSESESTSRNKAQESESEYRPSNSGKALALPEKRPSRRGRPAACCW